MSPAMFSDDHSNPSVQGMKHPRGPLIDKSFQNENKAFIRDWVLKFLVQEVGKLGEGLEQLAQAEFEKFKEKMTEENTECFAKELLGPDPSTSTRERLLLVTQEFVQGALSMLEKKNVKDLMPKLFEGFVPREGEIYLLNEFVKVGHKKSQSSKKTKQK